MLTFVCECFDVPYGRNSEISWMFNPYPLYVSSYICIHVDIRCMLCLYPWYPHIFDPLMCWVPLNIGGNEDKPSKLGVPSPAISSMASWTRPCDFLLIEFFHENRTRKTCSYGGFSHEKYGFSCGFPMVFPWFSHWALHATIFHHGTKKGRAPRTWSRNELRHKVRLKGW